MKYKWDKKILNNLKKIPGVKQEIMGVFDPSFDDKKCLYEDKTPLNTKITIDNSILKKRKYLKNEVSKAHRKYPKGSYTNDDETRLNISNDDLLYFTHDFYKKFDKSMYKSFLKIFNERYTHLKFVKTNALHNDPTTYYSGIANETFIKSVNNHDINSIITLIHEYGHAISLNTYPHTINLSPFTEIESIFPSFAAFDYLDTIPELKEHINYGRCYEFNIACDYINSLYYKYAIMEFLHNAQINNVTKRDIELISYQFGLSNDELNDIYFSDCQIMNDYTLGYLVAFELYNIYQKDQNLAINIYKRLLKDISLSEGKNDMYASELSQEKYLMRLIKDRLKLGSNLESFESKIKRN